MAFVLSTTRWLLLCGLLYFYLWTEVSAKGKYVILAPNEFSIDQPFNISVTILETTAVTNISVLLYMKVFHENVIVTSQQQDFQPDSTANLELKVPNHDTQGIYYLNITGSGGLTFKNTTMLGLKRKSFSIFIQLNKPIYKPGDKVHFRVVIIDKFLKPMVTSANISVADANGNRIRQWLNVENNTGVISSFFELSDETTVGLWSIRVDAKDQFHEEYFDVREYVLPYFEVKVDVQKYLPLLKKDAQHMYKPSILGTVAARYAYGKGVKGKLTLYAHIKWRYSEKKSQKKMTMDFDSKKDFNISMNEFLLDPDNVKEYSKIDGIYLIAQVVEEITGFSMNSTESVIVYTSDLVVIEKLLEIPAFKPGFKIPFAFKVRNYLGEPLTEEQRKTELIIEMNLEKVQTKYLSIPQDGVVSTDMLIPQTNLTSFNIRVIYDGTYDKKKFSTFLSIYPEKFITNSSVNIQLELLTQSAFINQDLQIQLKGNEPMDKASYLVLARGSLIGCGSLDIGKERSKVFSIQAQKIMAPQTRIIATYVTSSGELIADFLNIEISGIFKNKVKGNFSAAEQKVGSEASLTLSTHPFSTVFVGIIDKSVLFLKEEINLNKHKVISEIENYQLKPRDNLNLLFNRRRRSAIPWSNRWIFTGRTTEEMLQENGLIILTNVYLYSKYGSFLKESSRDEIFAPGPSLAKKTHVRKFFPETWIWTDAQAGSDGRAEFTGIVPDSITTWYATAFSIHPDEGLGLLDTPTTLTAFQPFFIRLDLPYSVIRGEEFLLKVIVFNYMSQDKEVTVTLEKSDAFDVRIGKGIKTTATITKKLLAKKNGGTSVSFWIVPRGVGHIKIKVAAKTNDIADIIEKDLLVKAEGVTEQVNKPILITLSPGITKMVQKVQVIFPAHTIPDSQHIEVSVIGDIMGSAIQGTEKFVAMPIGCGEQNMIRFAPNIYVYSYLKANDQLTLEMKNKIITYSQLGYQRQLTYKHLNDGFSAFGMRDSYASTWLTAFVMKCFAQASRTIPDVQISSLIMKRSLEFIVSKSSRTGDFIESGQVIHQEMQGGAKSGITVAAYVVISLLENQETYGSQVKDMETVIRRSTKHIMDGLSTKDNAYTLAICSYALALAGRNGKLDDTLRRLEGIAEHKGGMKSWGFRVSGSTIQIKSSSIETAAYVLLTYAHLQNISAGIPIVKWLVSQRNSLGGFSSTQDTVIGLEALTKFEVLQKAKGEKNITVVIKNENGQTASTKITENNSTVLTTMEMYKKSKELTLTAEGTGTALIQVTWKYNVLSQSAKSSLDLDVKDLTSNLNFVHIQVCASWTKDQPTGMVLLEIGMPTGFVASLTNLQTISAIKKIEKSSNNGIILYLDKLIKNKPLCIEVHGARQYSVAQIQQVPVRSMVYYQPSERRVEFYAPHILAAASAADVCGNECPFLSVHTGTAAQLVLSKYLITVLLFIICF